MTSTAPRWMQVLALLIFFTFSTRCDVFYAPARGRGVVRVRVQAGAAHGADPLGDPRDRRGGFWTAQPWIAPAAAGYLFYAAFSHL
jgi:hypothetical protein